MAFYNCLLFDMDGTLLDFKAAENTAIHETLAHFELGDTEENVQKYVALNTALWAALERGEVRQERLVVQRFEQLLSELGVQGDAVQMNDYYLTQLSLGADAMPDAQEILKQLAEVATLAVVSNGVERVQQGRLERSGLSALMDATFVSGQVGASKPARKIFDVALDTLGIENRAKVLVVGDSLKADIAGGATAGLATCWCDYDDRGLPENSAEKPTFIIHSLSELLPIVMEEEELADVGNPEKRHTV